MWLFCGGSVCVCCVCFCFDAISIHLFGLSCVNCSHFLSLSLSCFSFLLVSPSNRFHASIFPVYFTTVDCIDVWLFTIQVKPRAQRLRTLLETLNVQRLLLFPPFYAVSFIKYSIISSSKRPSLIPLTIRRSILSSIYKQKTRQRQREKKQEWITEQYKRSGGKNAFACEKKNCGNPIKKSNKFTVIISEYGNHTALFVFSSFFEKIIKQKMGTTTMAIQWVPVYRSIQVFEELMWWHCFWLYCVESLSQWLWWWWLLWWWLWWSTNWLNAPWCCIQTM